MSEANNDKNLKPSDPSEHLALDILDTTKLFYESYMIKSGKAETLESGEPGGLVFFIAQPAPTDVLPIDSTSRHYDNSFKEPVVIPETRIPELSPWLKNADLRGFSINRFSDGAYQLTMSLETTPGHNVLRFLDGPLENVISLLDQHLGPELILNDVPISLDSRPGGDDSGQASYLTTMQSVLDQAGKSTFYLPQ